MLESTTHFFRSANKLLCAFYNLEIRSKEIIEGFVDKTDILVLHDPRIHSINPDIVFLDLDFNIPFDSFNGQIIIISEDSKDINFHFKDQISDFLHKSDLTYPRFQESINIVKKRIRKKIIQDIRDTLK